MNAKLAKRLRREAREKASGLKDPSVDSVFQIRTYPHKPGRSTVSYRRAGSGRGIYKALKEQHA
jgi:hypothetical protein